MVSWWRNIIENFNQTPKRVTAKDLGCKVTITLFTPDEFTNKNISEDMVLVSGDSYRRLTFTNDRDIVFPPSNNDGWAKVVGTKVTITKQGNDE